jgi:hypothetical protein
MPARNRPGPGPNATHGNRRPPYRVLVKRPVPRITAEDDTYEDKDYERYFLRYAGRELDEETPRVRHHA